MKLLLAEDDPEIQFIARLWLTKARFEVSVASNGAEALDKAFAERPELILLDWMMPDLDAEEAFRAIRRMRADIRIVVSGPFPREEAERRFSGKKLAAYLEKPFRAETLAACIRALFEEQRASSGAKTG